MWPKQIPVITYSFLSHWLDGLWLMSQPGRGTALGLGFLSNPGDKGVEPVASVRLPLGPVVYLLQKRTCSFNEDAFH